MMDMIHLWSCSGVELLVIDGDAVLQFCIPLSTDAETPHLALDSGSSITLTDPSDSPIAN